MKTETVKLSQIKVNRENPRIITTDKFYKLVDSILVFPKMLELRPVVINETYTALGGNMRAQSLNAIAKMSIESIRVRLSGNMDFEKKTPAEQNVLIEQWDKWLADPTALIVNASSLTKAEQEQFIIKDNVAFGAWDYDALSSKFDEKLLGSWGMDVWQMPSAEPMGGFGGGDIGLTPSSSSLDPSEDDGNGIEFGEETSQVAEDDFDENEDHIEVRCKRGDVWQLGEHRLMCGDSTKAESYVTLLEGEKAVLCLTDPPYGIDASRGVGGFGSASDKARKYDDTWDSTTPDQPAYDCFIANSKNAIVFGGNYMTDKLPLGKHWIVWNKVGEHKFKNPFSDCELAWTNFDKSTVKMYTVVSQGFVQEDKGEKERWHPTQKSVKMLGMILEDYTKDADIVLDVFGGSGSTLIACEQLGRKCRMMELDPHYCDVILSRWEKLTGKTAELIA